MTHTAAPVHLVLASQSPRRRELLGRLGVEFSIRPADLDETPHPSEAPAAMVERLARDKAVAVADERGVHRADRAQYAVIAADTTVDLDGEMLAKPVDDADARRMLRSLLGRTHLVHTGVAVACGGRVVSRTETAVVEMVAADDAVIDWYVGTGEPADKAGAYGMQGGGGLLVRRIDGSADTVIGLPLVTTVDLLTAVAPGALPWHASRR